MTAVIVKPLQIEPDDITLTVEAKDYIDQDNTEAVFFISSEFMIVDDTYMVHFRSINFVEYQKSSLNN
ncbi:1910_t:CDS:2, partial [Racocetra persica]